MARASAEHQMGLESAAARLVEAPTLLIRGDLDTQVPVGQVRALYNDLIGVQDHKVFVHVACAAHQLGRTST